MPFDQAKQKTTPGKGIISRGEKRKENRISNEEQKDSSRGAVCAYLKRGDLAKTGATFLSGKRLVQAGGG